MGAANRRSGQNVSRIAHVVGIAGVLTMLVRGAYAADVLTVDLDQAQVTRLPAQVATVVVGNPLIADISLQSGGVVVVTGKGYGTTNIVALDQRGSVLMEESVLVRGPHDDVLVVYRGVDRETYSCTPRCERRMLPGDSPKAFDPALQQIKARDDAAREIASPPAPIDEEQRKAARTPAS